jgi:hypothetical protein
MQATLNNPRVQGCAGGLGQFKRHGSPGLLLNNDRTLLDVGADRNVVSVCITGAIHEAVPQHLLAR